MLRDVQNLWRQASSVVANLNENISTALDKLDIVGSVSEEVSEEHIVSDHLGHARTFQSDAIKTHEQLSELDIYKRFLEEAQLQQAQSSRQLGMIIAEKEAEILSLRGRILMNSSSSEDSKVDSNVKVVDSDLLTLEKQALVTQLSDLQVKYESNLRDANECKVKSAQYEALLANYQTLNNDFSDLKSSYDSKDRQKSETIDNLVSEYSKLAAECESQHNEDLKQISEVMLKNEILATKMYALECSINEFADRAAQCSPSNSSANFNSVENNHAVKELHKSLATYKFELAKCNEEIAESKNEISKQSKEIDYLRYIISTSNPDESSSSNELKIALENEKSMRTSADLLAKSLSEKVASLLRDKESLIADQQLHREETEKYHLELNQQLREELENLKTQAQLQEQSSTESTAELAGKLALANETIRALQSDIQQLTRSNSAALEEFAETNQSLTEQEAKLQLEIKGLRTALEAANESLAASRAESESIVAGLQQRMNEETTTRDSQHAMALEALTQRAAEAQQALTQSQLDMAKQRAELETEMKSALKAAAESAEMRLIAKLEEETRKSSSSLLAERERYELRLQGVEKALAAATEELSNADKRNEAKLKEAMSKLEVEKSEEKAVALLALKNELMKSVSDAIAEKEEYLSLYTKESKMRRMIHNKLLEIQGNIRVFCRVRPVLEVEKRSGEGVDVTGYPSPEDLTIQRDPQNKARFEFDRVFPPGSTQEEVFDAVQPLLVSALDGYNVAIFAYGQTGSGKTFTMEGYDGYHGVSPRAVLELFRIVCDAQPRWTYTLTLSILEIYNESIRDLLDNSGAKEREKLDIRQTPEGNVVAGLTEVDVTSPEQVFALMTHGQRNRAVGSHDMNEHSSRSHSIVTIACRGRNKLDGSSICGSERVSKTDASGDRLKEAQNINRSLSALGDVIAALGNKKSLHVPYRNSKLTFLLQDSLGGNSKVLMFVNVSPAVYNLSETLCSLNFATRCRNVELGAAKKQSVSGSASSGGDDGGTSTLSSATPYLSGASSSGGSSSGGNIGSNNGGAVAVVRPSAIAARKSSLSSTENTSAAASPSTVQERTPEKVSGSAMLAKKLSSGAVVINNPKRTSL